ncbi:hypothetical protein [Gemmata sp.]|uniref:hypothetical protein n=1 Tax=Gemmata sp. TaxID=1914242 RepID=UPI003F720FA7
MSRSRGWRRPKAPRDAANDGLVFITSKGESWHRPDDRNPISAELRKLLNRLGVPGNADPQRPEAHVRDDRGESRDQVVVDHIIGHARDDMASVYRERISDERLRGPSRTTSASGCSATGRERRSTTRTGEVVPRPARVPDGYRTTPNGDTVSAG